MASGLVCITLPTMTSQSSLGATPDCEMAALAATTASSVAVKPLSAPESAPNAVRLAPTMTRDFESLVMRAT
jgi:hypothetical protein